MGVVIRFPVRRRPRAAVAAAVFGPWAELASIERERARFFAFCLSLTLALPFVLYALR